MEGIPSSVGFLLRVLSLRGSSLVWRDSLGLVLGFLLLLLMVVAFVVEHRGVLWVS